MLSNLSQLDVFYGDLTVNWAFVYARLPMPASEGGWSLAGQVRGPRCLMAETLPVTSPLVDLGPGATLLARATVLEPCFWSPDLPAIYDVTVNLLRGTQIVATEHREIGLRALGVRGRHLALESKRWVLRGVFAESTTARLPRLWHEAAAGYVTASAADDLLVEASQRGALSVVETSETPHQIASRWQQLARFPSVAIVVMRGDVPGDFKLSQVAPNLLAAQAIGPGDELAVRGWANLLWAESDDPLRIGRIGTLAELPVIACRRLPQVLPIDQARAACDALQRDLASIGQFAGYVV